MRGRAGRVEVIRRDQSLAVGLLERLEFGGFGIVRVGREAVDGKEDVNRLPQFHGRVVLKLGIAPPWLVFRPPSWLGPVATPGDVDDDVARLDQSPVLVREGAVVGGEIVLLDYVVVVVLKPPS